MWNDSDLIDMKLFVTSSHSTILALEPKVIDLASDDSAVKCKILCIILCGILCNKICIIKHEPVVL